MSTPLEINTSTIDDLLELAENLPPSVLGLSFGCSSLGITPLRTVTGGSCDMTTPEIGCYYGGIA